MKKISRRSFLKASAVLGSAAALTACGGSSASTSTAASTSPAASGSTAAASGDTIKIGTIYAMSGGNAAIGENILRGSDFAVDEDVYKRQTGQNSLGLAAYMGLGAYVCCLVVTKTGMNPWVAAVLDLSLIHI